MPAAPICPRVSALKATERALKRELADALAERDGRNEREISRIRNAIEQVRLQIEAA